MEPISPKPQDTARSPRLAQAAFRVQRFVVRRAWSLLVLLGLSELGSILARKYWDERYGDLGRQGVFYALLGIGLVSFWLWPKRARFMRQLVGLLLVLGTVVLGMCMLLGANAHGWSLGAAWSHRLDYALGESGQRWFFSGMGLALVMGLGLLVRHRIKAKQRAKQGAAWSEASRPAPKPVTRAIITEDPGHPPAPVPSPGTSVGLTGAPPPGATGQAPGGPGEASAPQP